MTTPLARFSLGDLRRVHAEIIRSGHYQSGGLFRGIADVKIEVALGALALKEKTKIECVKKMSQDTVLCPRGNVIYQELEKMLKTGMVEL